MRSGRKIRRDIGLLMVALIGFAALPASAQAQAQAQAGGTSEEWIDKLAHLKPRRSWISPGCGNRRWNASSKADAVPNKRPHVAPQLFKLPQFAAEIQFDEDAAVVRPEAYRALGRIADTLYHPSLLGYKFLIVGHTASGGRRDHNLTLSQRRADAIRDALINTFKVSSKRLQAIGLGEEQLLDRARPAAPINAQFHVMTVGKML
jgi:outer membrane protein OmpA-like peptidoglycan-associated protein